MRTVTFLDAIYTLKTGRSPTLERRYPCGNTMEIKTPPSDVPYLETCSEAYLSAYFVMFLLEDAKRRVNEKKHEEKIS